LRAARPACACGPASLRSSASRPAQGDAYRRGRLSDQGVEMKRAVAAAALAALGVAALVPAASGADDPPLTVAEPSVATEVDPTKIDVMGMWAHPDDDAGFTTPCGVWHDRYGVRCGLIMLTRGEGGSNSVGNESGPALGLRRENEDRASHYRSGTVDIYNIDAVDFFYNTSAALTAEVWGDQDI